MSKTRFKLVLWAILIGIVGGSLWFALNGLAVLVASFQRGADPATALNIVPNVPPDLHVDLEWLPEDPEIGRTIEPYTRTAVESAYLRAWLQLNLSYLRNEPYGLKTYFVGPALAAVSDGVSQSASQGVRVAQVDSAHALKLHFYSADGSIVSFTDTRALVAQVIHDSAGNEVFAGETEARYDVVMYLEEGTWRVRHWVRTDGAALEDRGAAGSLETSANFVGQQGTQLVLNEQPFQIAGINYYPQATPWDKFWPNYDSAIIDHDFAIIRSLGLNTIRIFIPFEQFGSAQVDPSRMEQLADLLTRADAHGLKVIVTLFDFRTDYRLLLWPNADRQLEALLTRFKDNPAILAWDLKNEPDRDYGAAGRETVNAWLTHTARLARSYDPNHLLTIGWSSPVAARALPHSVDVVSFHYYRPASELPELYTTLRATVTDRPIVLTEFGLPSWNSFFFPNGHSQPEQAMYYADVLGFMRTTNASGYLAWTLYDFSHVPHTVAGRLPWQTEPQKHLGVLGQNGTPKRAALLLAPNASLDVPRIPSWARFLKPFWLTVFAIVVIGTSIIGRRLLLFERRLKPTVTHPLPDPSATRITQPLPELRAAPITQPLPDLPQALDRRSVLRRLVHPQLTMIRTRFQRYGAGQRRWVWVGMICFLAVLSGSIARYTSTTMNERLVTSGEPPFAPASNPALASATSTPRDPVVALASPTTASATSPTVVPTAIGVPTSTPTSTPTNMAVTPTPVPVPLATPAPTDTLVRFVDETFTAPASGWPTRTTATSSIQYADGRYQLSLSGQTDVSVSTAFSPINYRLSVDVVVMQGSAGLVFLSTEPATFYRFVIDTEGRYAIERHQQDTGITMKVVDWTEQGALQRRAGVLNRLRAERQGSTITFFANDQPLTTFPIPKEAVTNRYGFVLTSQAQQGEALFDNLVGERLPNS